MTHPEIDPAAEARHALEASLYECKRVVVGQDAMLERLLVALLTGGHVLLEGVPGLAKTLTVRTLATVLGGTFRRIQFTPDLVPADLVGTRIWQPGDGTFRTELGPVFANLLLADEINRAPAKVQSALLEVMQEHQVTIGGETLPRARALPRARHAEPDRVRGHLRPARGAGRPLPVQGRRRLPEPSRTRSPSSTACRSRCRAPAGRSRSRTCSSTSRWRARCSPTARSIAYAVALVDATRHPARYGLGDLEPLIQFGASPRASLGLVQAARALALLRGRTHAAHHDVRDLAPDVLRHRLVLSYDALADGVKPDELIDRVLDAVEPRRAVRLADAA